MNKEEYLKIVEENKHVLIALIEKYHPAGRSIDRGDIPESLNYTITAKNAEIACESIRKEIRENGTRNPISEFLKAKSDEDFSRMCKILNETWFGMPESTEVRREPGFFTLCDLCELPEDLEYTNEDEI